MLTVKTDLPNGTPRPARSRRRRIVTGTAMIVALATTLVAAPVDALPSRDGSSGVGDPFFPEAGNGGYDVRDYAVTLAWDPTTSTIVATAKISASATQNLDQFDIDLRGFDITSLTVDGRNASFTRAGQELVVQPSRRLRRGNRFVVVVAYSGQPAPVIDPDGSSEGWMQTNDGIVALGEPQGSPAWFPANDHPTDKATFSFAVTVPSDLVAVSNGRLAPPTTRNGRTTYTWIEDKPMATYLATLAIGHFTLSTTRTSTGLLVINAVSPGLEADSAPSIARIPEMVDWLRTIFGPYPFTSTGAIVVDAPDVGYALETQDRPTFTFVPDDLTMVHELAHQWVGNSVSVATWPEIWLNEGFAGYVEWLWTEHDGGPTAAETFADNYDSIPADDSFWQLPIGPTTLPDASDLFANEVYLRGAMTLQVLRATVGDGAFFEILRRWTTDHRYGAVTTAQFVALAERVSHQQLDDLFTAWLDTPAKPVL